MKPFQWNCYLLVVLLFASCERPEPPPAPEPVMPEIRGSSSTGFSGEISGYGYVTFAFEEESKGDERIRRFVLRDDEAAIYTFPEFWAMRYEEFQVHSVEIQDMNGDGVEDMLVIGSAMTGIGPTGAQPFVVAGFFVSSGSGAWVHEAAADEKMSEGLAEYSTFDEETAGPIWQWISADMRRRFGAGL